MSEVQFSRTGNMSPRRSTGNGGGITDNRILQLLHFLYNIYQDVLCEFFKAQSLQNEDSDEVLNIFIKSHADHLYQHYKEQTCFRCQQTSTYDQCIKYRKKHFEVFFEFDQGKELAIVNTKYVTFENVDITMLEYLLCAAPRHPKVHKWVVSFQKMREQLFHMCKSNQVSDEKYLTIWGESEETMFDILDTFENNPYRKSVKKQLILLKMASPGWRETEEYWNGMQMEFSEDSDDLLSIIVSESFNAPERNESLCEHRKHDQPPCEQLETPGKQVEYFESPRQGKLVFNVQAENVLIGEGKIIHDAGHLQDIKKTIENLAGLIKTQIGNTTVVARITQSSDKLGSDKTKGDFLDPSCTDKVEKCYEMEWKIHTADNVTKEEKDSIIEILEKLPVCCEGNVQIKFVRSGSIVIGTLVNETCVESKEIFQKVFNDFMQLVIRVCGIDTNETGTIEVDIMIGNAVELSSTETRTENEELDSSIKEVLPVNDMEHLKPYIDAIPDAQLRKHEPDYGSLMVSSHNSRFSTTSYANIDANEILYADFPSVQIQATSDYQHIVDGKCIAKMIKGKSYYLIKQVNQWWEITDGQHSSSFFVKCEYGQMKDPATELRMKPKQSLRKTTIDIHSKRDSCKHESRQSRSSYKEEKIDYMYDVIPADTHGDELNEEIKTQKPQLPKKRQNLSKTVSEGDSPLRRRDGVYFSNASVIPDTPMTPAEKAMAFRMSRSKSCS